MAEGNTEIGIAHPIATVSGNNDEKFAAIAKLIAQWQPQFWVVGVPTHADGTEHDMTRLAKTFGYRLNGRFRLPVCWVDECFSSVYAEELLRQAQVFGKKTKSGA